VGEVGVFFNRSKVALVVAHSLSTIVMVPKKAFALMFEVRSELRMKICSGLVGLSHHEFGAASGEKASGRKAEADLKVTEFEARTLRDLASKGVDDR
jgi:hypothetical protein